MSRREDTGAERRRPTPRKRPSVNDRSQRQRSSSQRPDSSRTARSTRSTRAAGATEADGLSRSTRRAANDGGSRASQPDTSSGLSGIVQALGRVPARVYIIAGIAIVAIVVIALAASAIGSCTAKQDDAAQGEPAQTADEPAFHRNEGPYSVSFATTGDIMFGREVSTFIDANGGAAALANVADDLAAADVTIANVECPLTDDESEALIGKDVLWRSNPAGIEALKIADITVATLANNHIMDYGGAGLSDTLTALDGAGILHVGAGMTEEEAGKLVELEVDGVSIAILSWTDIIPDNFLAYKDQPGVVTARLNMDDACNRVREAKDTHDIVIVAMHWGVEYQPYIDSAQQQDPAHKLVDAGADVIIGNHPHVIEGIEFYNGALISYSQGDFVCDHYSQETGESFILKFDITQDGIQNVTATPVYLDDTHGIPSIVTGDHAQTILSRLEEISTGLNASFDVKDDVAYISPTR